MSDRAEIRVELADLRERDRVRLRLRRIACGTEQKWHAPVDLVAQADLATEGPPTVEHEVCRAVPQRSVVAQGRVEDAAHGPAHDVRD